MKISGVMFTDGVNIGIVLVDANEKFMIRFLNTVKNILNIFLIKIFSKVIYDFFFIF